MWLLVSYIILTLKFQAVQEYYHLRVKKAMAYVPLANLPMKAPEAATSLDLVKFDDGSVVVVTESDLEDYDPSLGGEIWANVSLVYRVRVAGKAALARISCFWLRYGGFQEVSMDNHLRSINVDIHVY